MSLYVSTSLSLIQFRERVGIQSKHFIARDFIARGIHHGVLISRQGFSRLEQTRMSANEAR